MHIHRIALVLMFSISTDAATASQPASRWEPPSKLVAQLANSVVVDSVLIRPPKGYELVEQTDATSQATAHGWQGSKRADGLHPTLAVMTKALPSHLQGPPPPACLERALRTYLESLQRESAKFTATAVEHGAIGGLPFARVRWKGTRADREMEGFIYAGVVGRTFVYLSSQDLRSDRTGALDLAEAGALTVRPNDSR
jgi:hypothetical protein